MPGYLGWQCDLTGYIVLEALFDWVFGLCVVVWVGIVYKRCDLTGYVVSRVLFDWVSFTSAAI